VFDLNHEFLIDGLRRTAATISIIGGQAGEVMIQLEPIRNRWGVLRATIGKPSLEEGDAQRIEFPVRVAKQQHAPNESETRLATGEKLEDLDGTLTLCRGVRQLSDGRIAPSFIAYVPPFQGDFETPATGAGFSVQLFLEERLFDQVVGLSRTCGLPWIEPHFGFIQGAITAQSPDGAEKLWNNREHRVVTVTGAALAMPLADYATEETPQEEQQPSDPESLPPTLGQLDRRFRETHEQLIRLRRSLSVFRS